MLTTGRDSGGFDVNEPTRPVSEASISLHALWRSEVQHGSLSETVDAEAHFNFLELFVLTNWNGYRVMIR